MDIRRVTPEFAVAGEFPSIALEPLKQAGFQQIINNRMDGENAGQPTAAELRAKADELELGYIDIPVFGMRITQQDVENFRYTLDKADGSVLAFCRTGNRSIRLWALSQRGLRSADEIVLLARRAGYEISEMYSLLEVSIAS